MEWVSDNLVHVGYLLMLLALLARDILWLRGLLVLAQSFLCGYALHIGSDSIAFWNGLFVVINVVWVIRILRERRAVMLPDELKPIYERHFAALAPPEFLRLWRQGERHSGRDVQMVREGTKPGALHFLLSGEVAVRSGGRELARLAPGNFVAEMSLLTGEQTTADVYALGAVEYLAWSAETLTKLRDRNPMLWSKIQSVLGHDLVEKIKRGQGAGEVSVGTVGSAAGVSGAGSD